MNNLGANDQNPTSINRETHSRDCRRGVTPIAVVGPTGAGKSDMSLALAEQLGGEIINIDSMQLYKGMDIGTAKLPVDQRRGIPHHQLDIWPVTKPASVAEYRAGAIADAEDIMARGKVPIFVGGSMMYVQALVDEWDFPPTDPQIRAKWEAKLNEIGVEALHAHLATVDPEAAAIIETRDPRRTVRALEVIELTGKPFAASQPPKDRPARWGMRILGLQADPEWLNPRLEQRVDLMFERGLVAEVEGLRDQGLIRQSTAGQAIGYSQVLDLLDGHLSEAEAREATVIGTRRYARRQRSWFRRDPRVEWMAAAGPDPIARALEIVQASPTRE